MRRHNENKKEKSKDFFDDLLEKNDISLNDIDFNNETPDSETMLRTVMKEAFQSKSKKIKSLTSSFDIKKTYKLLKPALLAAVIISFVIVFFNIPDPDRHYAEIVVDKGEKIQLHINEEVTVWLNSNSKIILPTHNKKRKNISIEGEAYFEIDSTTESIYYINAGNLTCQVFGTSFNIKARPEEPFTEIAVFTGEIKFTYDEIPDDLIFKAHEGELASYRKTPQVIFKEKISDKNLLAWQKEKIIFENAGFTEITETISNYFQVKIEKDIEELPDINLTATFKQPELEDIITMLSLTFKCSITAEGDKIVIN